MLDDGRYIIAHNLSFYKLDHILLWIIRITILYLL